MKQQRAILLSKAVISFIQLSGYGFFQEEKMDLIIVIVPVYRVEKYIDQCIWSLRNQTYKNIEIILEKWQI